VPSLVLGPENCLIQGNLPGALIENKPEEGIHQCAIWQHNYLSSLAENDHLRRLDLFPVIDWAGDVPGFATICGAAEQESGTAKSEQGPGGIYQVGIEGIGSQRVLVMVLLIVSLNTRAI